MLERKIYQRMLNWKSRTNHKALLVTGARQIGKTYIIRDFGKKNYKNVVEINFATNKEAKVLFNEELSPKELSIRMSLLLGEDEIIGKDSLIFFDEIQEAPEVMTAIKGLIENNSYDFILSGSLLGVELKNIRSNPVGYVQTIKMFPLDFEEFCWAVLGKNAISIFDLLKHAFSEMSAIDGSVHSMLLDFFRKYIVVGGMPDAVNTYIEMQDFNRVREVQEAVKDWYRSDISKYCERENILKARAAFDLIPSEMNNQNKRFILKSLDEGARFRNYEDSLLWLSNANVALPVFNVSEPASPLLASRERRLFKLFYSDVGILTSTYSRGVTLDILSGDNGINKGCIYENVVAQELTAHGFDLYYYNNKKLGELDFVIENRDGNVYPIEVKSGKNYKRHNALNNVLSTPNFCLDKGFVFSNNNVEQKGKILYLPIYMISLLNNRD